MDEVGVRELRQNLSVYLRRVADGERFVVTEHREPVAMLAPLPHEDEPWERLFAEGRLIRGSGNLRDLPPPIDIGDQYAGTHALQEQRAERFEE